MSRKDNGAGEGSGAKSYEEQLRELWLEKQQFRGDFTPLFNCLKGGFSQAGIGLSSQATSDKRKWLKLHPGWFRSGIGEKFFTERV